MATGTTAVTLRKLQDFVVRSTFSVSIMARVG